MIKSIIVPLDGSELAESALKPGIALASRSGAELVLITTRWADTSGDTPQNYLDARIAFLDHPARPLFVFDREPKDAIVLAASEPGAVVCMATHGRGVLRAAALGSVAEAVVRESPAPVVLVGPRCAADWDLGDAPVVLAGLDGSKPSLAAAHAAGGLAAAIAGRVRAVEVLRPSDVITVGEFPDADVDLLEEVVRRLTARGVPADYEVLDGFDPANTLVQLADDRHAAFLALATHGRTGLGRVALGSVAAKAVRHARCPVLVVGPAFADETI
jgi:nucleotide-binding universal stress UspA family protein